MKKIQKGYKNMIYNNNNNNVYKNIEVTSAYDFLRLSVPVYFINKDSIISCNTKEDIDLCKDKNGTFVYKDEDLKKMTENIFKLPDSKEENEFDRI